MSALSLINTYSSDSEDDEIVKTDAKESNEIRKRLPLPGSIVTWKGVPHHEEVNDDPSQHDGRVRSFQHERGNWATLVYFHYEPSETMLLWMLSLLEEMPIKCNIFSEQFHISVTRTLILKFHWIESFVQEVKQICEQTNKFNLEPVNIQVYSNEEGTRTFLGIECIDPGRTLDYFINNLNKCLSEYKLPPFYEDFSCHISFLWCHGDETKRLSNLTSSLTVKLNHFLAEHAEDRYIHVDKIHLKIGNKLYIFKLK